MPYAGAEGILLLRNGKLTMGKFEVIPSVVKPSSKLSIVNVEITIQI